MITSRLKSVILKELDLDEFDITAATTADSVPGWDSLSHVRILMAVEAEFGIRLSTTEIMKMKRVGDLQEIVERKSG